MHQNVLHGIRWLMAQRRSLPIFLILSFISSFPWIFESLSEHLHLYLIIKTFHYTFLFRFCLLYLIKFVWLVTRAPVVPNPLFLLICFLHILSQFYFVIFRTHFIEMNTIYAILKSHRYCCLKYIRMEEANRKLNL